MKAKLFRLFFVGIFLMSGMSICAQTFICLQKDVDADAVSSDEYLKLYKHSTLKVTDALKVRIVSMTDAAKKNKDNIDGGLIEGAVFDVTKYDSDLSKVHYKDNKAERFGAIGVTISINYLTIVNGIEYLIAENDAKKIDLTTEMKDLYKDVFKYDEANSSLVYVPTATNLLPEGAKLVIDETKQISNIKENEPFEVRKGANIRLILSSEGTYFLDELFNTSDLEKTAATNSDVPKDDNTLYYIIGGVIVLLLILLGYFFMKSKKRKNDNSNGEIAVGLSGDMTSNLKHIIQQFDTIQGSLNQMAPVLTQINATISAGKEVEKLKGEIERQKSIVDQKNTIIGQKETEIGKYITQINNLTAETGNLRRQLEEANELDKGTLVIADGKLLAQKANGLLAVCRKGEEIIKQYISLLPESDALKMSYFLANYVQEMPSKSRDQWNGVMSTLSIKGFVNDLEITRYLQSESDQIGWLKKHFIEDLLQSYISPLVIMLDQIRCFKQFGITKPAPSNVEKAINEIIEECKKIGVTVKYKPLFELITKDDKERIIDEIDSDLPKAIESFVLVKENVPLFIAHIGVVAEGVKEDKTICIAKL